MACVVEERAEEVRAWIDQSDNPYGRRVAALRSALVGAVKQADMVAIARKLVERAQAGSESAAKLVFQYTLGKPMPGTSPDRVDHEEWEMRMERPSHAEVQEGCRNRPPLEVTLPFGRAMDYRSWMIARGMVRKSQEKDRRRAAAARRRAGRVNAPGKQAEGGLRGKDGPPTSADRGTG